MGKIVEYNTDYKTVIFDYDGTMFNTEVMQQYVGATKKFPRFSPEWVAARKEYISHIVDVEPYDGWSDVWKFLRENNIKAAIVSGNNREVLNVATKHFGLRDIFPKEKVNRIGCRDVNGNVVRKRGGNPTLFQFALQQLGENGDNVLAFGNEPCDSVAASKCGITAYNCMWGATDEDRKVMRNDHEHVCINDPKEIISILKSTCKKVLERGYTIEEEVSKVSDEDILTPKHLVKVKVGDKHVNLFAQRVEQSVYDKLHLSDLHYIKDPINKGATCLLFTDMKGRNVAFVGLLNNPSRSYPNAVMVSRIIVFPQFQHRGLSVPILSKVGAMLAAKGQMLFINTEDERFGKRLDSAFCWRGTTYDKKERKYYQQDSTHRNRKGGLMRRKMFVGTAVYSYSELFEKVTVLRERKVNGDITCTVDRAIDAHHRYFSNVSEKPCSRASVGDYSDFGLSYPTFLYVGIMEHNNARLNVVECVLMDINQKNDLKFGEYNHYDTS